jgi:hypothetical protein
LDESAWQIANPVEGQCTNRKVEATLAERDQLGIGGDPESVEAVEKDERRIRSDSRFDVRPTGKSAGERAVVRAEIERDAAWLTDIVETLDQPIGHLAMQKIDAVAPRCSVPVHSPGASVEQRGRVVGCHRSSNRLVSPS